MIYLDHHATTPCYTRVVEAMLPFFTQHFGNASSAHEVGRVAGEAVEVARAQVAQLLGARAGDIILMRFWRTCLIWPLAPAPLALPALWSHRPC